MNKKQPYRNDEVLPTCAVVGNAGSLRNAKFGEEIDAKTMSFCVSTMVARNISRSKWVQKGIFECITDRTSRAKWVVK